MRFSVAIALLAGQILPASTEEAQSILSRKDKRRQRTERILASSTKTNDASSRMMRNAALASAKDRRHGIGRFSFEEIAAKKFKTGAILKNENQKQCDPKSDDLDVGILSCGGGRYCVESLGSTLGGQCMLEPIRITRSPFGGKLYNKKQPTKKACDPNADQDSAADVGLLACGMGHFCKASEMSLLGGFCTSEVATEIDINIARRAEDVGKPTMTPNDLCTYTPVRYCDCNTFDYDAGDGTISCLGYYDECYSYTIDVAFVDNEIASITQCFSFTSPYEREFCYYYKNDVNGVKVACELSVNNQVCDLCNTGPNDCGTFDCTNTNVADAVAGDSCANEFPLPILEDLGKLSCLRDTIIYEACYLSNSVSDKSCDCSEVDTGTLTGTFTCEYSEPVCFGPEDTTCASRSSYYYANYDRSLVIDGRCIDLVDPYTREFCYNDSTGFDDPSIRNCLVDNVLCSSCVVDPVSLCYDFDCTNTIAMTEGANNADGKCDMIGPFINDLVNPRVPGASPSVESTDAPVTTKSPSATPSIGPSTSPSAEITEAPAMTASPVTASPVTASPLVTESPSATPSIGSSASPSVQITKAPVVAESPSATPPLGPSASATLISLFIAFELAEALSLLVLNYE